MLNARETNSASTVDDYALADLPRALRLVRRRATEWGIATNRIGVIGFSAGGEVAFLSAQRFDRSAPVSGAATLNGPSSPEISKTSTSSPVAAPEDGRTPETARRDSSVTINQQSSRPDFQALIYPGRTQQIEPATNSPPVFLVCGYNDRPDISEGLASVYLKFKQLKVPAAIHQPSTLNYQLPQKKPAGKWIERFEEWLADSGFLKKP